MWAWAWYFAYLSNCVCEKSLDVFPTWFLWTHSNETLKGLTRRQFTVLLSTPVTRITQDWTLLAETQIKVNLTVNIDSKIYYLCDDEVLKSFITSVLFPNSLTQWCETQLSGPPLSIRETVTYDRSHPHVLFLSEHSVHLLISNSVSLHQMQFFAKRERILWFPFLHLQMRINDPSSYSFGTNT